MNAQYGGFLKLTVLSISCLQMGTKIKEILVQNKKGGVFSQFYFKTTIIE